MSATVATTRLAAGEPPINFAAHQFRAGNMAGARDDFEQMLAMLISAIYPGARAIAANPGDWGIDAQRDTLARRREEAAGALQRAVDGLRLLTSLQRRAAVLDGLQAQLTASRDELADAGEIAPAGERAAVVGRVSRRYRDILRE